MAFSVLRCVVILHALLLCGLTVHGYEPLTSPYKSHLYSIYTRFNPIFQQTSHAQDYYNSMQFAVLTAGNLEHDHHFLPSPPQFASTPNKNDNYFAALPVFDSCGTIHSEPQLVPAYNLMSQYFGDGTDFYIFTYYSPCIKCARTLQNMANNNPRHNFHIGYLSEYSPRGCSTLGRTQSILSAQNIYFGDVSDQCSGKKRDTSGDTFGCSFHFTYDDYWDPWGPWGKCSVECDGGIRYRYRSCYEGDQCNAHACYMSGECNTRACARWSPWGAWGGCSKTCGGGTRHRSRSCIGYGDCEGNHYHEQQQCNTNGCPSSCFASDSIVRVKSSHSKGIHIERKRLDKLKVGEYVESYDPDTNSVAFSQVYFINHEGDAMNSSRLLKLFLETENEESSIRLHPKHLIYACMQYVGKDSACHLPPLMPVTAESVKIGDILWLRNSSGQFSPKPVVEIGEIWDGVRHPMTFSHYIVVDDVLASVHMLDEWFYRVGTAPLRYLYNIHPSITDTWLVKKMVQMWDSGESLFL